MTAPSQKDIAYHMVSCSVIKIFKERRTKRKTFREMLFVFKSH